MTGAATAPSPSPSLEVPLPPEARTRSRRESGSGTQSPRPEAGRIRPGRRREPRAPRARPARFSPLPRLAPWHRSEPAHLRDESAGGLCLIAARAPRPGSLLRIEIRRLDGSEAPAVLGRVRWVQPAPGIGVRFGVEIVRPGQPPTEAAGRPPAPLPRQVGSALADEPGASPTA